MPGERSFRVAAVRSRGCAMAVLAAVFFLWAFLDPAHSFFPSIAAAFFLGVAAAADYGWAGKLERATSDGDGAATELERAPRRGRVSRSLVVGGLVGAALSLVVGFPLQYHLGHGRMMRTRADIATSKSKLRNLASAQEIYYGDGHYTYTDDLGALHLSPSTDVTIEILAATENGFAATATHGRGVRCAVFVGDAPAPEPAAEAGVIVCRERQ